MHVVLPTLMHRSPTLDRQTLAVPLLTILQSLWLFRNGLLKQAVAFLFPEKETIIMKKRIDVIASTESFENLSTFTDVEEMNKTIRTYRDTIYASIKRADVQSRLISLLEVLKRHSCKYVGVSFLCKNSIADKLEVSYKTIQRLVKKLEDLGMIRQVAMKRGSDMLQTANAIIIIPAEDEVTDKTTAKESEKCPTIKTTSSLLKQDIKRLNKRNNSVTASQNFDQTNFIAHWVPDAFAELASCYYHEASTIQEMWKVVKQNNIVVDHEKETAAFNKEQELEIAIRSLKEFVMKVKSGKPIHNIFCYFNGIVNNLMDKLYFDVDFLSQN